MIVQWNKCQGGGWCNLLTVDLEHEHFNSMEGVYIIWYGGDNPATVRVGQGFIRDRLASHREDLDILTYKQFGLYVTWAQVAANQRDGVERYLAERFNPKVGSRFPEVDPIEVNLP
ncbi:hypothetical protein KAX97_13505 [candidate division WOR-3 bacterium]|nr:hypothetical protein [candidate division WOR-3 bacterium]